MGRKKAGGIYRITNTANGKIYLGSSVNVAQRWSLHKLNLERGTHHSQKLQRAWVKHGGDKFVFEVVEHVEDQGQLLEREQWWLDQFDSVTTGYNVCRTAGSSLGIKRSKEFSEKISARCKGVKRGPMSDEQKQKIAASCKGRAAGSEKSVTALAQWARSEEGRKRTAELNRLRKQTPEYRSRLSEIQKRPEVIAKRLATVERRKSLQVMTDD